MSAVVLSIEAVGPDHRARRLRFDDGTIRVTAKSVVTELALADGDSVDSEVVLAALAGAEYPHAMERALRLLGYRERSRSEVLRRLADDGYPSDVALAVAARLVELELLDDSRFASVFTRTRFMAGYGPDRVRRELLGKGVDPEVIQSALAEQDGSAQATSISREVARITSWDRRTEQRLISKLMRRGHSLDAIRAAIAAQKNSQPFIGE